ncbi:hypothetical protein [Sphingomonas jaspsi]|uniref:hypothetical protein n=1 Tax=Sphingomonas jaspsi TaxID=392409 RepID=UPI00056BCE9C|nr:hypothetical protein [Sphingomonas jaspsi]
MFDKLDAYNLVANLVPGAALTYALHYSNFPSPEPRDLGAFLLVSFVAGVTVNRLGSLILDPFLRRWRFLKPKDYQSFLVGEKADPKLEALVANAGLYRTFFVAGFVYLVALAAATLGVPLSNQVVLASFVVIGMIVFLFALRKEDGYIHTRIKGG